MVKKLLKFEGLFIFLSALYLYNFLHFNWFLFIILLLIPDISMIGYLKDKRLGAITYNLIHNFALGILIFFAGLLLKNDIFLALGIILIAHVGMDRFMGFGLKYKTDFKDIHMQKV